MSRMSRDRPTRFVSRATLGPPLSTSAAWTMMATTLRSMAATRERFPPRRMNHASRISPAHGGADLGFRCQQCQVDGVPEQAVAGPRPADEVVRKVDPGQDPMQPRQDQIRQDGPKDYREP